MQGVLSEIACLVFVSRTISVIHNIHVCVRVLHTLMHGGVCVHACMCVGSVYVQGSASYCVALACTVLKHVRMRMRMCMSVCWTQVGRATGYA